MGDAELITVVPLSPAESLVLTRGCQGFVWILPFVFKVQWLGLLVCRVFISLMYQLSSPKKKNPGWRRAPPKNPLQTESQKHGESLQTMGVLPFVNKPTESSNCNPTTSLASLPTTAEAPTVTRQLLWLHYRLRPKL